jgi:hypothetical protein
MSTRSRKIIMFLGIRTRPVRRADYFRAIFELTLFEIGTACVHVWSRSASYSKQTTGLLRQETTASVLTVRPYYHKKYSRIISAAVIIQNALTAKGTARPYSVSIGILTSIIVIFVVMQGPAGKPDFSIGF